MRNVFICGAGRSGTSMLAGLFSGCGYYQGEELYSPRNANPKGFFENWQINSLNERIINSSLRAAYGKEVADIFESVYREGHYWLGRFPSEMQCVASEKDKQEIAKLVEQEPFCYKDTRFPYTLPAWQQASPGSIAICIFRHPGIVVASMLKEMLAETHLRVIATSVLDLFAVWENTYFRLLEYRANGADVYFINYNDLFSDDKISELERLVGAELNRSFPDAKLARTEFSGEIEVKAATLFESLSLLASRPFAEQSPDACRELLDAMAVSGKPNIAEHIDVSRNKLIQLGNISELVKEKLKHGKTIEMFDLSLTKTFEEREQSLAKMKEEHEQSLARTIEKYEQSLAKMNEEHEQSLARTIEKYEQSLAKMNEEHEQSLAKTIETYKQSLSWRVTRPLRSLEKWIGGLFGRD